ncbi:MAG: acyl-CoA dehydrogenase family protein, partial [Chloroflexi bacterium]|nr:acyl-CoA dehydrogenase family protein [Chloroflexota bacterium]
MAREAGTMNGSAGPQFNLNEEQDMLVRMAREFTADNITPVAAEYDENATFPADIFHKARELGIVNMLIPEEYGGVGASAFEEVLVSEELGYGCTGISTSLGLNSLAMLPILLAGSPAQKAYWMGDRLNDQGQFAAYGVTEANAGSNVVGIE